MRLIIVAALLVLALAGCTDDHQDPVPSPSVPPGPVDGGCDAQAASNATTPMEWVRDIVYMPSGELRPRVPGMDGHPCTADWLAAAMDVPGWEVGRQAFTGSQYLALDRGQAAAYDQCPSADRDEVPELQMVNLFASLPSVGEQNVLLAAHWDAKEDASDGGVVPAANDGASGMGVLLALQRTLSSFDIGLPYDVTIAFFDAEDGFEDCHPLAGSLMFSRELGMRVDRMILLDMVGDPDARFPREAHSVASDEGLVDLIWSKADANGLADNFVDAQFRVIDDHVPFIEDGVRAVDIIDYARGGAARFPPYWHTSQDTPDNLDAGFLQSIHDLVMDVLIDEQFVATL